MSIIDPFTGIFNFLKILPGPGMYRKNQRELRAYPAKGFDYSSQSIFVINIGRTVQSHYSVPAELIFEPFGRKAARIDCGQY